VPWTTFFVALLIGLPLFFEVGFVLLVPIAIAISKRVEMPILRVGLPMLAGTLDRSRTGTGAPRADAGGSNLSC
jgi:H+/gluconate symporter-like permease